MSGVPYPHADRTFAAYAVRCVYINENYKSSFLLFTSAGFWATTPRFETHGIGVHSPLENCLHYLSQRTFHSIPSPFFAPFRCVATREKVTAASKRACLLCLLFFIFFFVGGGGEGNLKTPSRSLTCSYNEYLVGRCFFFFSGDWLSHLWRKA